MDSKYCRWFLFLILGLTANVYGQSCTLTLTATAPENAFVINDDDTVTDTRTGLMWARCPEGLSGSDCHIGNVEMYSWREALARAATLSQVGGVAGYTDWRLPNIKELRSIVEYSCAEPAINQTVFPGLNRLIKGLPFWSSSPARTAGGRTVWTLWFKHGKVDSAYYTVEKYGVLNDAIDRLDKHYLRFVREAN